MKYKKGFKYEIEIIKNKKKTHKHYDLPYVEKD